MPENDYPIYVVAESTAHNFIESTEPRAVPHYEFSKDGMTIYDPVWGECHIGKEPGDEVLLELTGNPLVRRTMAIEQLTLDKYTETIPGAAEFSRWEHIWGSLVFVRRMTESLGLDARERLVLQLRTFVSDLGHTAYSHLGDWMFQGAGGSEDQHDQELLGLLEKCGINDVLRKNDILPDEVIFPEVADWIETPQPDLCVDRVDFGSREIQRWAEFSARLHYALQPEAFQVIDGKLVMADKSKALDFAKAYLLLPTEHWNEPLHRLQLFLQEQLVKRVLTSDESRLFSSGMNQLNQYHPRDYMYSFDFDLTWEQIRSWDPFLSTARLTMEDIGKSSRRNFVFQRKGQLAWLFSEYNKKNQFPEPLIAYGNGGYQGLPALPPNVSMLRVDDQSEVRDFGRRKDTYDVSLPSLKQRYIDPLYLDDNNEVQRLSQADAGYRKILKQQREISSRSYVARLHLNPDSRKLLKQGISANERNWQTVLERPRMDSETFLRMIGHTSLMSGNHRFVTISVADVEALGLFQAY